MITLPQDFQINNNAETLVVLLHGITSKTGSLHHVRKVVDETLESTAILYPELPARVLSFADPNQIVQELLEIMDQVWAGRKPYKRILLIGHSLGALLARKLYICACGENPDAPFEASIEVKSPRAWAHVVERIILLAGMNRGWTISHNLSLTNAISFRAGAVLGHLCLMFNQEPLLFQVRCGAPFITQLRLQWLSMRKHIHKDVGDALTVQLLGKVDDIVGPDDNIDLVTGRDFIYLDVPWSGHKSVIDMDASREGQARSAVLKDALLQCPKTLRDQQILPVDINLLPEEARKDVTDVVFVIHGIRDRGFWTHKIAREVKALGKKVERKFETETSSYGYFPMLPFLLPWIRRAKVEWLMNEYVEDLALYPNAQFSFVGHSNGTYLLAKALEEYPACRFKHVVFAGSVVPTYYDWGKLTSGKKEAQRVSAVLNYVATADWVVAFFPKLFQLLHLQDLGSAGHDGFDQDKLSRYQVEYVRGGHNAAIREKHWEDIAHFIVYGELNRAITESDHRSPWIVIGGILSPLIWLALILLVVLGGVSLWQNLPIDEWAKTLVLVLYAGLVWTVVTKV
ncbi:MAG: hypothetical protein R3A44_01490 [Caldilineaceae bacterium]